MSSRTIEIQVGLFVALGFAALFMLTMKVSNLGQALFADAGYTVTAKFQNVGGLKVKSPVKMAGVTIGRITDIHFSNDTYQAVVAMSIDKQYDRIPTDTSASIFTAGLLGEQYIGLEAGGDVEFLADNSELFLTQSAVILEQLIGKFLYNQAAGGNKTESP